MKVLWLCNNCPGFVSKQLGHGFYNNMGWLDYIGEELTKTQSLCVVYPSRETTQTTAGRLTAYTFPLRHDKKFKIKSMESFFEDILIKEKPDVIHIQGTEFPHSFAMTNAADELFLKERVVISIQGLVSVYAKHYYSGLPLGIVRSTTIRDFFKCDNIIFQKKSFEKRGRFEKLAIKNCNHIIGRTDWDRACAMSINPSAQYHFCNEVLRKPFYEGKWCYENCEKHSIFVSQSSYPIKGLHLLLEQLPAIKGVWPDVKVYVTGTDPFGIPFYRIGTYRRYLKRIIAKHNLRDNVVFLGSLDEKQMRDRYLKSNVFVLCSSIENSPNSLGEAMILGVPVVAADVGGVRKLSENTEVEIYPFDEPYMLPYYVGNAFLKKGSENVKEMARAKAVHDEGDALKTLLEIYCSLIRK